MKKITMLILFALVLAFSQAPVYATDDIEVQIDGTTISFQTSPEMKGQTIMVPMKEFFEALGARVIWVESERMVVAYKDNMHMKLQIGNNIAFRNGKRFTMSSAPYVREGRTLVPIQIIAETFELKPLWNSESGVLSLESSDDNAGLKLFADGIYKTRPINELGITISIPYHWEKLDGPFQYGYQDDFESYSISLMTEPADPDESLSSLVDKNKAQLLNSFGTNIIFTGEEFMELDDMIRVKKLYITTTSGKEPKKQVLYIFKQGSEAYYMTCNYGPEVPEEDIIEVFDNIMTTFNIRNMSIDSDEEHYMEFVDFYNMNIHLNQEFYSNMVVEKSMLPFSGTLKEGHGLEGFKVKVSSDKDTLEFMIPISGNAFDGTIYTPFGLGKHNILITGLKKPSQDDGDASKSTPPERIKISGSSSSGSAEPDIGETPDFDGQDSDPAVKLIEASFTAIADIPLVGEHEVPLIQFSVINIDARTMRYRIPTNIINSADSQIHSTSQLLTYQVSNEYMKARSLFTWIHENMDLETSGRLSKTNIQVFDTAIGSEEEINQLYVAFLRALDIPSRVVRGTRDNQSYFWTELHLNGSWVVSDVVEAVLLKDDNLNTHVQSTLFNINMSVHREKFDFIQIMPY